MRRWKPHQEHEEGDDRGPKTSGGGGFVGVDCAYFDKERKSSYKDGVMGIILIQTWKKRIQI